MSEENYSTQEGELNSNMNPKYYLPNNDIIINEHIKKMIEQDIYSTCINSFNEYPLNDNTINYQNDSSLRLRLHQNKQIPANINNIVVLPLMKVNKVEKLNKVPFDYRKYISNDFDPDFWKQFYSQTEPFFNFEYDEDNLREIKLINKNRENPKIIEIYEGQVNEKNEKHGLGKLTTPEKTLMGHWRKNQFTGWGREINKNGEICEGKFINGKLYGKGMYSNGNEYYVGEFRNNNMIGYGEIFNDEYHYYGQLWNKVPNGKGKIHIYKEGNYEGYFENGEMDGNGVFKWNNGDYYIGDIKKGKMNGKGKLIHNNGFVEDGYFRNGHFIK